MTGPEHYREAERLLADQPYGRGEAFLVNLAEAQVHATLALTAASAAEVVRSPDYKAHDKAWAEVAGPPERKASFS